ncbi:MAG: glycosyltransferase family 39 protein [Candidatus Sumerlaeia bacterium]|nr:glycosyltransferase family 39 protein [Candidatus Sumerlaeia bacterium]
MRLSGFQAFPAAPPAILAAALLFLYLSGNWWMSLWDRDEPRYAVATREMLASGDFIVPTFNGRLRFDKPPMTYWLMAPPVALLGPDDFSVRLAQALFGVASALLLYCLARRMGADRGGALVAMGAFGLATLHVVTHKASTTDSFLVFSVVAAFSLLWELRRSARWGHALALGAVLGFSILVKGPPGPLVVGLAALAIWVWEWRLRGSTGHAGEASLSGGAVAARAAACVGVAVLVAAPWAVAVQLRTLGHPEGDFLSTAIGRHVVHRATAPKEGHTGPFFYYLLVLPAVAFPFAALFLSGARRIFSDLRGDVRARFLAGWFIPGFVVFSAVVTKLPHYVAPLLPALALGAGLWWSGDRSEPRWCARAGALLTGVVGVGGGLGLAAATFFVDIGAAAWPARLAGLLLAGGAALGARHWWRGGHAPALRAWAGAHVAALLVVFYAGMPLLEPLRPGKPVTAWLRANAPAGVELAATQYQEPSLVFYWGGRIEMIGAKRWEDGRAFLRGEGPRALLMPERTLASWTKNWGGKIPEGISVKFTGDYYDFQKGGELRLHILGNW